MINTLFIVLQLLSWTMAGDLKLWRAMADGIAYSVIPMTPGCSKCAHIGQSAFCLGSVTVLGAPAVHRRRMQ